MTNLPVLRSLLQRRNRKLCERRTASLGEIFKKDCCTDSTMLANEKRDKTDELLEPTNCCMSGCANCVWIEYADKLSLRLQEMNNDADVEKIIMEKVQDPNMRAFLAMELRWRKTNS